MIGLPLPEMGGEGGGELSEEEEIVNFVSSIAKKTAMHFNVNVGIFVPKPHTPYQWVRQIDRETAAAKLEFIRSRLRSRGHKVSISDTLVSMLEGILSRGDERAGDLFERAFHAGSRLDAWQEFINRDVWLDILQRHAEFTENFFAAKDTDAPLPWRNIVSGITASYLRREFEKSAKGELSPLCAEDCASRCGVCSDTVRPHTEAQSETENSQITIPCPPCPPCLREMNSERPPDPTIWRLLFSFAKEESAVFHGHLSLIEIFSMAMGRAGLDVLYTQGFNPLAKLEIVSPLSVGISAGAEIAAVDFSHEFPAAEFLEKMNASLPEGIIINRAEIFCIPAGSKKHSLSSLLWGFGYAKIGADINGETAYIPAAGEKAHREQCLSAGGTVFSLRRACVLAKNTFTGDADQPWVSYFDCMQKLYPPRHT